MIDIQVYFQILFWNWENIRNFLITRDRGKNKLPVLQILHLFTSLLEFFKTHVFLCLCICDYSLENFDLDDAGDLRVCVSPARTQVTQGMKELRCCRVLKDLGFKGNSCWRELIICGVSIGLVAPYEFPLGIFCQSHIVILSQKLCLSWIECLLSMSDQRRVIDWFLLSWKYI